MEAHAIAQLRSPNTVRLFDYGVGDDGELFAVMEFLNGFDLHTLVERFGVLPPARVIPLLDQVCLSLAEAHDKGLVHRDVKPANLMLCQLGCQSDLVKVLDFGLVGSFGQPTEARSGAEGEPISGTPGYIAPEVLRGARADARSDMYAVGAVAYWLLTGTTLFPRDGGGEDIGRHLTDSAVDPAVRRGEALPQDLTSLVLRLVSRNPDDRPQSVQELRRALRACASSEAWTEDDANSWWQTHGSGQSLIPGAR
jgi:serine/threonine-protein kinase